MMDGIEVTHGSEEGFDVRQELNDVALSGSDTEKHQDAMNVDISPQPPEPSETREPLVQSSRPRALYNDLYPKDRSFWVEITPKPDGSGRNEFEIDEEEFRIVGIFGDIGEGDDIMYEVQFEDDHTAILSLSKLLSYTDGDSALAEYDRYANKRKRLRNRNKESRTFAIDSNTESEDELTRFDPGFDTGRSTRERSSQSLAKKVARRLTRSSRSTGSLLSLGPRYREDESDITFSDSSARHGGRRSSRINKSSSKIRYEIADLTDDYESEDHSSRTSRRSSVKLKSKKAVEYFPLVDEDTEFAKHHHYWCMFSNDLSAISDDSWSYAMCQGCTYMYHVVCLGQKDHRQRIGHNIIVLDERDGTKTCVLQCGRCSGGGKIGMITMRCLACGKVGDRCGVFKHPEKSELTGVEEAQNEEKLLEGWNDASKLIFRCMNCKRACHFDHLPKPAEPDQEASESTTKTSMDQDESMRIDTDPPVPDTSDTRNGVATENGQPKRPDVLENYTSDGYWACNECFEHRDKKVDVVLGWRSINSTSAFPEDVPEVFTREYLVKFEEESYARATWVPATWLAGISYVMKANFDSKKFDAIGSPEDVILEAWLCPDIIFDVRYDDDITREQKKFRSEAAELEAISQVTSALCKWQKLQYEESMRPVYRVNVATWENPPAEDSHLWPHFKAAYAEYVRGNWIHRPNYRGKKLPYADLSKSEDVIQAEFGHRLELKEQPKWVEGGEMFDYQIEGMNWLYFQWFKQTSAILADEMGLGKTIQIIAMVSTIFKNHQRWPFLVIAPNSTIENWRREFRKWAPSLKVVAWPGTAEAREYVGRYELGRPKAPSDLKAHVVITGYGTARTTVSFLRKYDWECLIVDEGQALKNDKSDLFHELCTLNVNHRVILTGTPLQNNIRELFNIMQFLDPQEFDAGELQDKYQELDEVRVREIHTMLRPRFLRRTKADVLAASLPPKSEIIIPLSMSSVQKELYKSIISQNPELMKVITTRTRIGKQMLKSSVPKLQNTLMQLRRCLAHPFIQAPDLEDRTVGAEQEKRALIEASGKLSFLAKILPKLKEHGHRVLIFSQFLDMLDLLEDFLTSIEFQYGRLDGSTATIDRQHMIDEFNSPNSTMDCFLLSTRAGGAGINLATADTVIVFDPDHNPHQDMQALARAHRIGQQNKVLVFRLMTRNTVEEKIYQTAKKKMVLDHLIVESLDNSEEKLDVERLLLHGLKALFEDTDDKDIKYDDNDIDKLLDRTQIEEMSEQQPSEEGGLGSFKTARIWANSTAQLEDLDDEDSTMLEVGYWDRIIQERKMLAEAQELAKQEEAGRGKRKASRAVDYAMFDTSPHQQRTVDNEDIPSDVGDDEFRAEPGDESDGESEEPGSDEDAPNIQQGTVTVPAPILAPNNLPPSPADFHLIGKPTGLPSALQPSVSTLNFNYSRPAYDARYSSSALSTNGFANPNPAGFIKPTITEPFVRPPSTTVIPSQRPVDHFPWSVPSASVTNIPTTTPTSAVPFVPVPRFPVSHAVLSSHTPVRPNVPTAISSQHPSRSPQNSMSAAKNSISFGPPPGQIPMNVLNRKPPETNHAQPSATIPPNPIKSTVPLPSSKDIIKCFLCSNKHRPGLCPLRNVPVQRCPACGYCHIHAGRVCPIFQNVKAIDAIQRRLNESPESIAVVTAAKVYVRGVRGNLVKRTKVKNGQ